jgi:hypothetical protein
MLTGTSSPALFTSLRARALEDARFWRAPVFSSSPKHHAPAAWLVAIAVLSALLMVCAPQAYAASGETPRATTRHRAPADAQNNLSGFYRFSGETPVGGDQVQVPADGGAPVIAIADMTVLGNASNAIVMPQGMAIDPSGNIFIADAGLWFIESLAPGNIWKLAPDGTLTSALGAGDDDLSTASYTGVAVDQGGDLYFVYIDNYGLGEGWADVVDRTDAPLLTFNSTPVGSKSSGLAVTVENDGNAGLSFNSITAGPNAALDPTTTCSSSHILA